MADVFVRGFDFGTTEQDLKKYCQKIGPVTGVDMFGKGAAVVTFANADNAEAAVAKLERTTMPGQSRYIELKMNDKQKGGKKRSFGSVDGPSCRVYVRGFDFDTTDEQFEGHMSQVGSIKSVKWITKGSAVVEYSSPEHAESAVATLNETTIEGNSRFIDVIMKEAGDHGPSAKKAGDQGKGAGKGAVQGMWVFQPAVPQRALMGLGSFGKGMANKGKGKRRDSPPGCGKVFVRGFDFGTSDEELLSHMKRSGPIADVHWITKGSAVVTYNTSAAAQKAVNTLNQTTIQGNSRFIDVILKDTE